MNILIIGGTAFVGRALVNAGIERGHNVTLFNRGQRNPTLFPEIEKIKGDRDGNLSELQGRTWDAVIDTCGYFPRIVGKSANYLAKQADHYTFVSTLSVYRDFCEDGIDESYPVGTIADETVEEKTGESYGPLKALCEMEVQAAFPERALIVRPGMIVGPHDHTDRFTYWVDRVAKGGKMLAPGKPQRRMQVIDVRDLAGWIIRSVESKLVGVFNASGPDYSLTMEKVLETAKEVTQSQVELVWMEDSFLDAQQFEPYTLELPFWFSESNAIDRGVFSVSNTKAIEAGLTFRSLSDTLRDLWEWSKTRSNDYKWNAGLAEEKEEMLIVQWKQYASISMDENRGGK